MASTSHDGMLRSGSAREATVMFADISGFTALSEKLDPEDVTAVINACFEKLESVILAHGGLIDAYLGDCVKAVFGYAPGTADPITHAVQAALEVRAAIAEFNRERQLLTPLEAHIGVSTGSVSPVSAAAVAPNEVAVLGEAVRLAARLEDASGKGQIYIGPVTYERTKEAFEYRPLPALPADGAGAPIPVYELLAARTVYRVMRQSERRQATVLFADLLGVEALAARVDEEAFAMSMTRCFAVCADAVMTHGGVVDKYTGNGVMALFGIPNAIENAPTQAVNAAIAMRDSVRRLRDGALPVVLDLRAGINTGLVIAGEIGGRLKRDFTAMGDTVNLAARLKEAAAAGTIYVGSETHRSTAADFDYRALELLRLKGKERPVPAYELVSDKLRVHRAGPTPGVRAVFSEMVGRERELAALHARLAALRAGIGGMVSIIGEAGMGKSRLVAELLQSVAGHGIGVFQARALPIGQNLSFHPFVDFLRPWAGIGDDDAEPLALPKLQAAVRAACADQAADIFPFVARLMAMELSGTAAARVASIEGDALERLIVKSMRDLLACIATQRPLLIVFEDLHWADLSSIGLLEAVLRLTTERPLLLVAVARPQFDETAGRVLAAARALPPGTHSEIHLDGLDATQTQALIRNLLHVEDLPESVSALIAQKAEGNPFYIEEVVRSLIDEGAIEFRDGGYRVTEKMAAAVIPGTVQDVIMARVDRLPESARHVLQVASVIGRSSLHRMIADVMQSDETLEQDLLALKEKQLLLERGAAGRSAPVGTGGVADELEYVFKHALAQETIYASLLLRTRKELHWRVARSVESLFAERLPEVFGLLAYHYTRAEEWVPAHEYLFKAGEAAARSAAWRESLEHFQAASAIYTRLHGTGGDRRRKAALEKHIALALLNIGEHTASIRHFDAALQHLGEPVPSNPIAVGARFAVDFSAVLLHVYLWPSLHGSLRRLDLEHEREVCELFLQRGRAEVTSDPRRLFFEMATGLRRFNRIDPGQIDQACSMYVSCAGIFAYSGLSFAISNRMLRIASDLVRPGSVQDRFVYEVMRFTSRYLQGDWNDTHTVDEGLVDEALHYGQVWDVTLYLGLECDRRLRRGDFAAARVLLKRLMDIKHTYGYAYAESNHDGMRAILLIEERQLRDGLLAAEAHLAASDEGTLKLLMLGLIAKAQLLHGEYAAASETLAAAATVLRTSGVVSSWHQSTYLVSQLRSDLGALERAGSAPERKRRARNARQTARRAVRVAAKVAKERPEIYNLTAQVWWVLGHHRRAMRWWTRSIATAEAMGARPELARIYRDLGARLSTSHTDATALGLDAAACLARAQALFETMGLAWDLNRLHTVEPALHVEPERRAAM